MSALLRFMPFHKTAFHLFALKIYGFSTSVFFFLYVLVRRLFHFMNVPLSWFVRVSIHLLLFSVLLFWSICEDV